MSFLNFLQPTPKTCCVFLWVQYDNTWSHKSDVMPVMESTLKDLGNLGYVKYTELKVNPSENRNGRYTEITDRILYRIDFPPEKKAEVNAVLEKHLMVQRSEKKPTFLPSMGPGITKPISR